MSCRINGLMCMSKPRRSLWHKTIHQVSLLLGHYEYDYVQKGPMNAFVPGVPGNVTLLSPVLLIRVLVTSDTNKGTRILVVDVFEYRLPCTRTSNQYFNHEFPGQHTGDPVRQGRQCVLASKGMTSILMSWRMYEYRCARESLVLYDARLACHCSLLPHLESTPCYCTRIVQWSPY